MSSDGGLVCLDDYLLLDVLGEGAFGVAWRAVSLRDAGRCRDPTQLLRDPKVEKVVVKRFKFNDRSGRTVDDQLRKFRLEHSNCQRMLRLSHPNVLRFQRSGYDPAHVSLPYLVFDYCEGGDLLRFVRERQSGETVARLSATEAACVALQLTSGIWALHNAGLAHRDLALRNVFWRRDPGTRVIQLKIGDFGLCELRNVSESDNTSKFSMHNPPDRAQFGDVKDRHAVGDVFGLALVIYELLTLESLSIEEYMQYGAVLEQRRREVNVAFECLTLTFVVVGSLAAARAGVALRQGAGRRAGGDARRGPDQTHHG